MTTELRDGEGTLRRAEVEPVPPPDMISESDMELILAFQQDVAVAQRAYSNLMSQMAARYQLRESDQINSKTREITRQS